MNPVKRHRVVRHSAAAAGESDPYSRPAIESAENEGWPPRWLGAQLVQILHAVPGPRPGGRWSRKEIAPSP